MLRDYLPQQTYTVAAAYENDDIVAIVAGARIHRDNTITLSFPKLNPFLNCTHVTLHLDNRTGVEEFDADLRVYRCSYKGTIIRSDETSAVVEPQEYQLMYSNRVADQYVASDYAYPQDTRREGPMPETPLQTAILVDDHEHDNKLGVLITRSVGRPHTTVMAFLSTEEDDVFLITDTATRKAHNLHRDSACCFAIDHRATYLFEKAYDWNYTIIKGFAYQVSPDSALFADVQRRFIEKNPWETVFFSSPGIEMYHIKAAEILCPDKYRDRHRR